MIYQLWIHHENDVETHKKKGIVTDFDGHLTVFVII